MENHNTFVPNFTEYGNQPKTIAVAWIARSALWVRQSSKRKAAKRTRVLAGVRRASGRKDPSVVDAWHKEINGTRGKSWCACAPRSPSESWLQRHGYQQLPF